MDMLLYFAFGALSIGLLYWITNAYKRVSGVDLFPGRGYGNVSDVVLTMVAFILSGYFGMMAVIAIGTYLFLLWLKYYRKK